MSDRPMRLKYLTKMKIILCIFLLYITAVSVFGQSVELNGIVGESVKFPAAVKKVGNLIYSNVTIGDVINGRFTGNSNYKFNGRVRWDSNTGLFSLSKLEMEDIGEYKVQNTDQNINTVFQLNVYKDNVTAPAAQAAPVAPAGGAAGIWQTEGSKMWSLCLVLIVMVYSHLV